MGLDMYAYKTKEFIDDDQTKIKDEKEIGYWRKHNRLHGWFEEKYFHYNPSAKGTFNCDRFWLSREILDDLEETLRTDQLPATSGFFFGNDSYKEEKEELAEQKKYDLAFVDEAKKTLNKGEHVYYTCWW
jgi:hypothetical protein|tara:strand:- start:76 stop:465 length:390 start_codon:yes stop_codon:yes gene_type:complete